jgi:tetratricopeptide (TPR) repeat protein
MTPRSHRTRWVPLHAWAVALWLLAAALLAGAATPPGPSADVLAARQILDAYSGRRDALPEALMRIERSLKANPDDYFALKELSRYHVISGALRAYTYRPGSLENAESAIREALRIAPDFPEGHIFLGHIQLQQRKLDEALASLLHAAELGTSDPSLDLNLARVYAEKGDLERNLEHSRRVLANPAATLNQKSNAAWYLAQGDTQAGDVERAASRFEEQVRLNPTNAWVRGDYANYLSETLGRHDDAIAEARKTLELLDYGVGRRFLAMALYRKWGAMVAEGKANEAEAYFVEAQSNHPSLDHVMADGASHASGEQLARALMESKGISIDAQNERGATALSIAVRNQRPEVVKRLLELGADPNFSSSRLRPVLVYAAQLGDAELVEILLARTEQISVRPAMQAAGAAESEGHTELAQRLRAWDEAEHAKWMAMHAGRHRPAQGSGIVRAVREWTLPMVGVVVVLLLVLFARIRRRRADA